MKKTLCVGFLLAVFLLTLSGCDKSRENSFEGKETTQESFATEATEHSGNPTTGETTGEEQGGADWSGITENGVDEDIVFQNLDIGVLEEIAEKLQNRVKEAEIAEAEDPTFTLEGKWYPFMFDSNAYKEVVALGEKAMLPLFWILYKSPNAGLYEYTCASALAELSEVYFEDEAAFSDWKDSRDFLEQFINRIAEENRA